MGIHLAEQTLVFFYACLLGALFGAVYDVFRILRVAIPWGKGFIFAQDIVFFLFCAAATFLFLLAANDGVIRVFLFIGEVLGATLYYCTLGRLVMAAAEKVIRIVKRVARFIFRYICLPIWRFFYGLVSLFTRPFRFLWRIVKKSVQRLRFRLKTGRVVLYNHLTGYFKKRKPRKRSREKRKNGAKENP